MPTPEQMQAAVHAYVDAFAREDSEGVVALFAEDATVEDPVGTPAKVGHDAIREFYTMSIGTGAKLELQGPIRVGGDFAAFAFQVRLKMGEADATVDVIDVFRFDDAGKVRSMQAFFGPGNFTGM
ncbi:steroid delta-isomerase [Altererythrobacter aerius]|uniref:Steroid delta-isomerase n=1 Tax=Tsuneonella aeria TaxID=1837929 RepID=A0A6I4TB67_9SPHN|nr:nuclear transport factor 2 family protein [Tsuneonella aeria]MXO74353.1 steroid delta-isomerase [Tsuneonella aeria]